MQGGKNDMEEHKEYSLEVKEGADESIEIGLPEDVLKHLGLKEGDTVAFERKVKGVCVFKIEEE